MPKDKRNGIINKYNVKVTKKISGEVLQNKTVPAESGEDVTPSTLIHNLEMYVTYAFEVQAFTKKGAGNFSEPRVNRATAQTGKAAQEELTPVRGITI